MKKLRSSHARMLSILDNPSTAMLRISNAGNLSQNGEMTITDYRRRNLINVLKDKSMKRSDLARLIDKPMPNVSQMLNGPRSFGSATAREIEEKLNLRPGYLDEEVPLTNQAIGLARSFQRLNDFHRAEVESLVMTFSALEEHQREAAAILPNGTAKG